MDWAAFFSQYFAQYFPILERILVIVLCTLGVVYMSGRLLFTKLEDKGKNIIAFVALIVFGFLITLVYDYDTLINDGRNKVIFLKYLLDSVLYVTGSAVGYILIGWRLFNRISAFLDRKVGKGTRRKNKK